MTERIRTLLDLIRDHMIVRRLVLLAAIVMCWRVGAWGVEFAMAWMQAPVAGRPSGVDVAAVIAAATAPVTLFAGSVFRAYVEGRK